MEVKKFCKVCGSEIHPKRVALGYKDTCVNHSTTEKYVGRVTETDTETYEIQVIKNPQVARDLQRLEAAYRHM